MSSGDLKSKGVKAFFGGSVMKKANCLLGRLRLKIMGCRSKVVDD
jgi:hypothetical protein